MQRGDRVARCLLLLLGTAWGSPGDDREEAGCWEPLPGFVEDTLFRAAGASGFANTWPGWYGEGHFSATGDGKQPAYDSLPLLGLRFSNSRGGWAQYRLHEEFDGLTLLQIVQRCMGSDRRSGQNDGLFASGHCTLGLLCASADLPGAAPRLTLGLGGMGAGPADWALFALKAQPGRASFDDGGTLAIVAPNRTAVAPDPTSWVSIQGLGLPGLPVHSLAPPDDSEAAPLHRPESEQRPPAFLDLQAPEELRVEGETLLPGVLAEVSARSGSGAILAIHCSVCPDVAPETAAAYGVSCSFRQLGAMRASLQLRARSLPLGVLSCNASDVRGATGWSLTNVQSSRSLLEVGSNGTANDTDDSDDPTTIPPDAATTVAAFTTTMPGFDGNETSTTTTADDVTTTATVTHTRIVATTLAGAVATTTATTASSATTLPPNATNATQPPVSAAPTAAPTLAPTASPTAVPTVAPPDDNTTTTTRTTVTRTTVTGTTVTGTVTTATTVTVPPIVVAASMEMQVTQAAIFLTDDRAADAVRSTVAAWLSIPTNIVAVSLSAARRLRGGRRLQQEGKVRADIELAYPAGQGLEAERAKAAVPMAFTKWNIGWLQDALDVWCGAGTYTVSVLSIGTGGTVVLPPREREPGTDWGDYVSLTLLILAVILLCCLFCFFYYRRRREDPRQIVLEPEPKAAQIVETVPLKAAPAPAPMPTTSWKTAEDALPLEPSPKRIYEAQEVKTASERGSPSQTPDEGGDWNSLTRSKKKQRTEESPPETLQPLPRVPENLKQMTWI